MRTYRKLAAAALGGLMVMGMAACEDKGTLGRILAAAGAVRHPGQLATTLVGLPGESAAMAQSMARQLAAINTEIELMAAQFGLPTRTEVDSLGRKVQALTRELRRGKAARGSDAASTTEAGQSTAAAGSRAAASAKKTASPGARRTPARSAASPAAG